jgi:peptidoglycan/xylan/chitin deacetylase (PgdA/CDA1 family)
MLKETAAHLYSAARKLGVDSAWRDSGWRQQRLLVLCWHGISLDDEHEWNGGLYIPQSLFRHRLKRLSEGGYRVLSLDEGLRRLWAGELPPRSVVITFDDGFYDFAAKAVPVLQEFAFPATLYLTTYYVDYQRPVFNLIVPYMLWKQRKLPNGTALASEAEAEAYARQVIAQAEKDGATAAQKDGVARSLASQIAFDYDAALQSRLLHLMTPQETQAVIADGSITIEGHTHRHRTPEDVDLMTREFRQNNDRIQEITGRRPIHFCYPSGVFRRQYFPLLEQEEYRSATTCELGIASKNDEPYLIPRLLDHMQLTGMQYDAWLSGLYALGRRRAS